jgi:hypothetical protein
MLKKFPYIPISLRSSGRWILFIIMLVLGLWPILTTVIVADDLVGPFAMYVNAGPDLLSNLRVGYEAASYGHFNYLGQIIGGFVNWLWLRLMVHGFRYSTIYALTKFIVFFFLIVQATRVTNRILVLGGSLVSMWTLRTTISLCVIGTFQLHLVWSNDPVGSYPMSGYMSILIGLCALETLIIAMYKPSIRNSILGALALLVACLYYEMNVIVFLALAVLMTHYLIVNWDQRKSVIRKIAPLSILSVFVALVILFLQHQNSAKSAQYTGTAIALGGKTTATFGRLLVSNLPMSSWHLGLDWIQNVVPAKLLDLSVMATIGVIAYILLKGSNKPVLYLRSVSLVSITFIALGASSTFVQAATQKVQDEATRIGSVYNFYAVGSTAVVVILSLFLIWLFSCKRSIGILILPFLVVAASFQFMLNSAIQENHYQFFTSSRNLLVAYTENWGKKARCEALGKWLEYPWPAYYSNSLATGMEWSYLQAHGKKFCGRY